MNFWILLSILLNLLVGIIFHWPSFLFISASFILLSLIVWLGTFRRSTGKLEIDKIFNSVHAGDSLNLTMRISGLTRTRWLWIYQGDEPFMRLDKKSQNTFQIPVETRVRGKFSAGPYSLIRKDPWGFSTKVLSQTSTIEYLVYPKLYSLIDLYVLGHSDGSELFLSNNPGSEAITSLREYQYGDEIKKIHWPASSRTGKLVVKEFSNPEDTYLRMVIDNDINSFSSTKLGTALIDESRFETTISLAASIIYAVQSYDRDLYLNFSTENSEYRFTVEQLSQVMDLLAVVATGTNVAATRLSKLITFDSGTMVIGPASTSSLIKHFSRGKKTVVIDSEVLENYLSK